MRALLDTNILIDYLGGVEAAREEIARLDGPFISSITWMEPPDDGEPFEEKMRRLVGGGASAAGRGGAARHRHRRELGGAGFPG